MRVLFVGINPGIRSSLTGHHFAGYSNRFWTLLHDAGLVPEPVTYVDDDRLPGWGYGITNIVPRPTRGVGDLRPEEFDAGRARVRGLVRRRRPAVVVLVGVTVGRAMLARTRGAVAVGLQPARIGGAAVFVLPNPSGRNAHFSYAEMLAAFRALRRYVDGLRRRDGAARRARGV